MKSALLVTSGLIACAFSPSLSAQSFQPRGSRSANPTSVRPTQSTDAATQTNAVSADLLQLYAQTKSVRTEADATLIARSCTKVVGDKARSKTDREYASSLFAWALNRRGELRSEQAAKLVEKGEVNEAAQLDQLAIDDFKTAVEYGPENWRVRHNLAIAMAMRSDYAGAIEQLSQSIELKPDYPNAYFNRAELYFELEQYAPAIEDYSRAIQQNNSDPQYYNSRGHCHFMLESFDSALADYRRATELGSDSAVYQTDLADAHQFLGNWEDAAKGYRAAVAINNQLPRAYQNAAWLMATCPDPNIRNVELALSAAKKALELAGTTTPQALDTLAAATAAAGRYAEAVKLQQQAIALTRDPAERSELGQRMEIYRRSQAYIQPQSLLANQRSDAQIRTASGTDGAKR